MTFKLEKETKWNQIKMTAEISYIIWADNEQVAIYSSEKNAIEAYEIIKEKYIKPSTETIKFDKVDR